MEAPPEYTHTANTAEQSATVTLPSAYYPEDSSIEPIPISIHQLHQIDVSPAPPPSCHTTETSPRPRSVTVISPALRRRQRLVHRIGCCFVSVFLIILFGVLVFGMVRLVM